MRAFKNFLEKILLVKHVTKVEFTPPLSFSFCWYWLVFSMHFLAIKTDLDHVYL